jgi:hypothetical protein
MDQASLQATDIVSNASESNQTADLVDVAFFLDMEFRTIVTEPSGTLSPLDMLTLLNGQNSHHQAFYDYEADGKSHGLTIAPHSQSEGSDELAGATATSNRDIETLFSGFPK